MDEVHFPGRYSELRMETMDARNARYFAPGVSLRRIGPNCTRRYAARYEHSFAPVPIRVPRHLAQRIDHLAHGRGRKPTFFLALPQGDSRTARGATRPGPCHRFHRRVAVQTRSQVLLSACCAEAFRGTARALLPCRIVIRPLRSPNLILQTQ